MAKLVRYGNYLRELASQQNWIGIRTPRDEPRWLRMLCGPGTAILWLTAILVLFQLVVLRETVTDATTVAAGMAALVLGVFLFREGARTGLMPFGDAFARAAAARLPLAVAIGAAFILGLSLPFVEPVIAALQAAGAGVQPQDDPYLHALLRQRPRTLVSVIGVCTGAAVALGMFRILRGWSLRPLILVALVPALGLSGHLLFDPELARVPALAWDCGALAGGPVSALLLLAFGSGTAGAAGSGRQPLGGFGMVAFATLVPVVGVLVYAMILAETTAVEDIVAAATSMGSVHHGPGAWAELRAALIALGPLLALLYLFRRFALHETVARPWSVFAGLALCLLGLALLGTGAKYGLGLLSTQVADGLAALLDRLPVSWPAPFGLALAAALAGAVTWHAARAEPALNVFAEHADARTHGVLRRARLVRTIAAGAAIGAFAGMLQLGSGSPVAWLLVPGWLAALALAAASGEMSASAAWDGAAMMTGPLTLTVLAAAAAGFAAHGLTGFGLPAMCVLGSVLAVLITGARSRLLHGRRRMLRNSGFAVS